MIHSHVKLKNSSHGYSNSNISDMLGCECMSYSISVIGTQIQAIFTPFSSISCTVIDQQL